MPSVNFDGTNDSLSKSLPSILAGNPGFTLFVTAKGSNTSGQLLQLGSSSGAANNVIGLTAAGGFDYNQGSLSAYSDFATTPTVGVFRRSSGSTKDSGEFYRYGDKRSMTAISATGSPSIPSSSSNLTLANGLTAAGANQFYTGKIYEVMMFSGDLNDHAVGRIEGYLAWKWGGQSNLVTGHPYKSSRPQFGGSQSITLAHTNVPVDSA